MKKQQKLSVVSKVKQSMFKQNRLAMLSGAVLGGFVPVATYVIGHYEVDARPMMWLAVAGGLAYSAKSVFDFASEAFASPVKALGFVVLIEAVMTFSETSSLSLAALALLVAINAIAAGINLALESKQ